MFLIIYFSFISICLFIFIHKIKPKDLEHLVMDSKHRKLNYIVNEVRRLKYFNLKDNTFKSLDEFSTLVGEVKNKVESLGYNFPECYYYVLDENKEGLTSDIANEYLVKWAKLVCKKDKQLTDCNLSLNSKSKYYYKERLHRLTKKGLKC